MKKIIKKPIENPIKKPIKNLDRSTDKDTGKNSAKNAVRNPDKETDKKIVQKSVRKFIQITIFGILFAVLYVFLGVVISYKKQPDVSAEYQSAFRVGDCYGDTALAERACIIEDNEEALYERLRMIAQAKERVILSTFEFRSDESGKDVLAALLAAAKRGVKIQILADGATAFLRMDRNAYFYALAASENVEIKIYNRVNLLKPWKSMGRLHDKYVIVDDWLYLLGGRNTYDYFLGDNGYKNYDRDVLVYSGASKEKDDKGDGSLCQLEAYFASVWELEECSVFSCKDMEQAQTARRELESRFEKLKKEYPFLLEKSDYREMTFEVNKITLLSNPIHVYAKEPTLFYSLTEIMKSAKGSVMIHTPYIICNDWMYESFREVCDGNPNTSLFTNSAANNGNPFGASDYLKNKGRLLDTGLTVYEYEGGVSYHGKSILMGERLSAVGSFNMDMRSAYLDTELMLVIDSKGLNQQLRENMQAYEAQAAKAIDEKEYEIPEGVERQKLGKKKERMLKALKLVNWFRFLM